MRYVEMLKCFNVADVFQAFIGDTRKRQQELPQHRQTNKMCNVRITKSRETATQIDLLQTTQQGNLKILNG